MDDEDIFDKMKQSVMKLKEEFDAKVNSMLAELEEEKKLSEKRHQERKLRGKK